MDNQLSFNKIAIIYNEDVKESFNIAMQTKKLLNKSGYDSKIISSSEFTADATFVITIGGDGTLLKSARFYAPKGVPLFGINLGRLGFLAQANLDEIEFALKKIIKGEYKIEERMMLSSFDEKVIALNDIVIKGDSFSRTSKLFLSINDKIVCDYLADGIIISTPTGSTAYTLSAGGPVVVPGLDAIVIVPICPHTLTARPLVIPAYEKIRVTSCKTCNRLKMSADGQDTIEMMNEEEIVIEKSKTKAKLVILEKDNNEFYSILRTKLQWGVAPEQKHD